MHSLASRKVNAYFAALLITVVGSGAALTIVHVASSTNLGRYAGNDPLSAVDGVPIGQP